MNHTNIYQITQKRLCYYALSIELTLNKYMDRPLCKVCGKNPRAPAYYRYGRRYYRARCSSCIRKNRNLRAQVPRWQSDGYKKKPTCDLCGFKSRYSSQLIVYHIDGNLNNSSLINLRTVCLNCIEVVKRNNTTWRIGDLTVD